MTSTFQVRIVTPTGIVFEGEVEQVSALGPLGEFGVLPQHINFITSLVPGILEARISGGETRRWIVSGGLAEVKDGLMTVLAGSAELPETVDPSAAAAEVKQADQKFSSLSFYDPDYNSAQDALLLARARASAASLKSSAH
jgi:F-type H+-transporting ATPase subunit epsilon